MDKYCLFWLCFYRDKISIVVNFHSVAMVINNNEVIITAL